MKRIFVRVTTVICILLLAGCSILTKLPDSIKIPVPVPCNIKVPVKPYMPYTDVDPTKVDPKDAADLYFWDKLLLAETEERKGYETELEGAITACNFKSTDAAK